MKELAAIIATNTRQLDAYFAKEGLPSPSFDQNSPAGLLLNSDVVGYRQAILDATDELHALMQGPIDILSRQPVSIREPSSWSLSIQLISANNSTLP